MMVLGGGGAFSCERGPPVIPNEPVPSQSSHSTHATAVVLPLITRTSLPTSHNASCGTALERVAHSRNGSTKSPRICQPVSIPPLFIYRGTSLIMTPPPPHDQVG